MAEAEGKSTREASNRPLISDSKKPEQAAEPWDTPPDWREAVSASQVAGAALVRGPAAPPPSNRASYINLDPLCCIAVAIESQWLDSASTRSVPVDISGRQPSICATPGHCPGKSAPAPDPQMGKLSHKQQPTGWCRFPYLITAPSLIQLGVPTPGIHPKYLSVFV